MTDFSALQALVLGRPQAAGSRVDDDPLLLRLEDALAGVELGITGPADLAALIRQAASCDVAQVSPRLRVPGQPGLPTPAMWAQFGCEVQAVGPHDVLVTCRSPGLEWLGQDCAGVLAEVEAAIRRDHRNPDRSVRIDECVKDLVPGWSSFLSPGQREAVRAAFLSPPGSTTIVTLPTGSGKTLAFQLPALRHAASGGLVVVVVPTVALALDQEERFLELLAGRNDMPRPSRERLAYHGGLAEAEKSALLDGIRGGDRPIIFTSPEAAVSSSLTGVLIESARAGRLKLLAVDEAHLVDEWGEGFRPEFRVLAGLRRALLDAAASGGHEGFRTLLLTATLTKAAFRTLAALFDDDGAPQVISEACLRTEIAFAVNAAPSRSVQTDRVLEALRYLPRPLLLYTTERAHAEEWCSRLRTSGFLRTRLVRGGDMSGPQGASILADWRSRRVDIIVATSAFGLGMDQSEVRSVVHACVPESIERYYQEVGRAGRDGKAAISLLVSAPDDFRTAKGLAAETRIGWEKGLERWLAMFDGRVPGGQEAGLHELPLDAVRRPYTASSARNRVWNLRTLVLMAQAGLLRFALPAPKRRLENETSEAFGERVAREREETGPTVAVRILDEGHRRREVWETRVDRLRAELAREDADAGELVEELKSLRRPLSDLFRSVYSVGAAGIEVPPQALSCPVRRARERAFGEARQSSERKALFIDPPLQGLRLTGVSLGPRISRLLAGPLQEHGRILVSYRPADRGRREDSWWRSQLTRVLEALAREGMIAYSLPSELDDHALWIALARRSAAQYVYRATDGNPFEHHTDTVPCVTVLWHPAEAAQVRAGLSAQSNAHVLVLPSSARDPERQDRLLCDIKPHLTVEQFWKRLES